MADSSKSSSMTVRWWKPSAMLMEPISVNAPALDGLEDLEADLAHIRLRHQHSAVNQLPADSTWRSRRARAATCSAVTTWDPGHRSLLSCAVSRGDRNLGDRRLPADEAVGSQSAAVCRRGRWQPLRCSCRSWFTLPLLHHRRWQVSDAVLMYGQDDVTIRFAWLSKRPKRGGTEGSCEGSGGG
jgi:hypothetical protein